MEICLMQELFFIIIYKVKKAVFFCHFAFITFTSDEANAHIAYRRITHSRSWYIIQHQREELLEEQQSLFFSLYLPKSIRISDSSLFVKIKAVFSFFSKKSLSNTKVGISILQRKLILAQNEWNFVLCLTICVPKYFAVIQSGGRRFWFQCQRRTHPCRNQLSWTGHCIGTYLQHWQPKGWLLQMERLMELD